MFCSIEDAWGEKSFVEKPLFKQSDRSEHFSSKLYDEPVTNNNDNLYSKYMELKEMFDGGEVMGPTPVHKLNPKTMPNLEVCDALDAHIAKCPYCRSKYMLRSSRSQNNFGSFDLDRLGIGIKSNKDIVTIFLFGLLVILLLQLLSK